MKRSICVLGLLGATVFFLLGSHSIVTRPLGYETLSGWERTVLKKFSGELLPVSVESTTKYLLVPAREEIAKCGYPKNEEGKTFGPELGNESTIDAPILQLAIGTSGVTGYLDSDQILSPSSLDDVEDYYRRLGNSPSLPLYMQDGETVIGQFHFYSYIPDGYDK